ncbi:MAG: hypothetical protein A2268_05930 [Candidatus Raymondbacteria bacterium RifOxyA12_full_50_37]|uniref:Polymerase/histidinol phosphatase N-terminal domain-containing protein n=1 Tax=Candidatus Raymondbacteria bacterium RIFOXYD12_FULL_49_13 TaxID=1817890 RepID=A0A1F7FG20_UNCRA|nr:MAG: hypothetical protein A2268_05930 [Candidatus Raymondbacteria bacterium RifOxyA12_full_50_37]OGJ94279.1 MAG: hypothetical protein A2248_14860 [Candidatus Raymondbacteria bacterium RIFOXYA2_FULL_49_16]OGJ96390.1 MAG: hypothetical protein A2487_00460 [Candidatus Raymondbacteria bacterium RifOxyC12_full_50_8]OGJ99109.1 MAG: hypothetical protein A2453_11270 [Candidatus Raymondbacteria bacterium RIFOXYC2_FULL_50_21]OGK01207.1 MAG: hypothetical protein A2350_01750 [Candidatus Raymondbacteria b
MLFDLHLHTTLSDGAMKPADIARLSKEQYTGAGVADHISPYQKIRDEQSFAAYRKELLKHDLLAGAEICLGPVIDISQESLSSLDYIIGSIHALFFDENLSLYFWDDRVRFPNLQYLVDHYAKTVVHFLDTAPINIMGHPTLLPMFMQSKGIIDPFSDSQIHDMVAAGVRNKVAFEISSRWKVPSERFLRECARQGAFVSLGSDAHTADQAFNLDFPLQMMEKTGIDRGQLFVPVKKTR